MCYWLAIGNILQNYCLNTPFDKKLDHQKTTIFFSTNNIGLNDYWKFVHSGVLAVTKMKFISAIMVTHTKKIMHFLKA